MAQVDLDFKIAAKKRFPDHRELFAAGEHVQSLIVHPGWATVMEMLDERIASLDAQLDGPSPLAHVDYAHRHGERRGLRAAREAAYALEVVYVDELERQRLKYEAAAEPVAER